MNETLGDKIIELRNQKLSYKKIAEALGCSKSVISYYCGSNQKEKNRQRSRRRRKSHPYLNRLENFIYDRRVPLSLQEGKRQHFMQTLNAKITTFSLTYNEEGTLMPNKREFGLEDVIAKLTETPACYLTGDPIDIHHTRSYAFDHIVPRSRGGDNSLDNLGICTTKVNQAKGMMTPDEFIHLCKKVLEHNGYQVEKVGQVGFEPTTLS